MTSFLKPLTIAALVAASFNPGFGQNLSQSIQGGQAIPTAQINQYETELRQSGEGDAGLTALTGCWRGTFYIQPGLEIPFSFDIQKDSKNSLQLYFRNSDELFEGGPVEQKGDSIFIRLNQFDNELAFHIQDDSLVGTLRRQDGTGQPLTLSAIPNTAARFKTTGLSPVKDYSGVYAVSFLSASGKEEKSVGIFQQTGAKLTATFLHITGDSRYLDGVVEGNTFRLSTFIGSSPSLYTGSFSPDGQISGQVTGAHGGQQFTGKKDEKAALPDAYTLTQLKEGYKTLDFSFPDVNGKAISLNDAKYRGKVVVVTIGGTWCPNCIDESSFLAPWYTANRKRGIEVISIQYERQLDSAYLRKVLTRMRTRFGIKYDQVVGGTADKKVVAASLPALNNFLSFPTTIFIDRQGKVARIHTGFNGPATGHYYQDFIKEFNEEIDTLAN